MFRYDALIDANENDGVNLFIVVFSLFLASIVVINNFVQSKENDLEQRALITSRTVAEMPEIREKLKR